MLDHWTIPKQLLDISWTVPEHFSWMELVQEMLKCTDPMASTQLSASFLTCEKKLRVVWLPLKLLALTHKLDFFIPLFKEFYIKSSVHWNIIGFGVCVRDYLRNISTIALNNDFELDMRKS